MEITAPEQKRVTGIKRNEDNLRDLWHNIKCTNIHIIGVPEGEEREKGEENIFEDIIAENFPNLGKETEIQAQKAQRAPNRINPKKTTPRHIVIKMAKIKDKERILKAARGKQQGIYKRTPISLSADFSAKKLHRPEGSDMIYLK